MIARYALGWVTWILALSLVSCGPGAMPTAPAEQEPTRAATSAPASAESSGEREVTWAADGLVEEGEYTHAATVGQMRLWWSNNSRFLYLAFEAEATGMLAVGLDPENRMQGANYLIGFVQDGQPRLWDAYGTAPTGNTHPPDTDLGGSDDIVAFAGVEEGGVTRFEVQVPLNSGDTYDKMLQPGETYSIIVAASNSDDYAAYHTFRAGGQITLDAAP